MNLTAGLNYQGSNPFPGVISAIEGVNGSNSISAASVDLSAATYFAGQSTVGTSSTALNVNAPNVALTTSGNLYVTTGGTLSSLAVTASHPVQNTDGTYTATSQNYTYHVGGSTTLTATDNAATTSTSLNFSSATPVNFSFTTDRTIDVGTINAGAAGTVTLNASGSWTGGPYYDYTHIGIEQGTGTGITAGTVNLYSTGYEGHAGTTATALNIAAAHLAINVDGSVNVADSVALNSLSLTLTHAYDPQINYTPDNTYALTAPNIALTLQDLYDNGFGVVALEHLVSTTLQSFSLDLTDANLAIGPYGTFGGGQFILGSSATANLTAQGIWAQTGGGGYTLSDTASSAVPDSAVAVKVGTLNLSATNSVTFSAWGCGATDCDALPIEVANLSVNAGGGAFVQNVGNLNVVSANIVGSGYFRAVEAAPATPASLTGGSLATPITAGDLTLVAFYGDIGTSVAPVITNTASLTLESGADIYAANQQQIATLSVNSDHHKASIGDTSNGGLNTLVVTDTTAGAPLQLGVTDLGAGGGGYQVTGLNAPQLNFSFETDDGLSVGSVTASSVALTSDTASILHIPGIGTITAGSISFTVPTGQSVGAAGQNILISAPTLTVNTGGNMAITDSATLDSVALNIGSVRDLGGSNVPVYQLNNSAAANPLTFNVTADIANNTLDINSIAASRTDAPAALTVHANGSSIGVNQISDDVVSGGTVNVWTESGNVFGLGATPAGISASTVSLIARGGSVGDDANGTAQPFAVTTDTLSVLSSGDIRITSPQTITNLTLQEWNAEPGRRARHWP